MVTYLEHAGCYFEFEAFFMNCFNRIRHEFHTRAVRETIYATGVDVDELTDAAQEAIDELSQKLTAAKPGGLKWNKLEREIRFAKAVLVRDYHDFGEANRRLSAYLLDIADDPAAEAETQADFLRANYPFPFVPEREEE